MTVKNVIAEKSLKLRHKIVKTIAPNLYINSITKDTASLIPRPTIVFIKKIFGNKKLTGLEIGVMRGDNAESILELLNIKKLYLVDPYETYTQSNEILEINSTIKAEVITRLWKFQNKIQFVFLKSDEAVNLVPDNMDFVYIDGNHDYRFVKKDIENYYPKIKKNGVIGGHDFNKDFLGVIKAVVEFVSKHPCQLYVDRDDWWIRKTEPE